MKPAPIRQRVETTFERWGRLVIRHRWLALVSSLLLTALFVSVLPELEVDNSVESNFRPDDPAFQLYNTFREQFDRDDRVVIALTPSEVFSFDFLEKLRAFHRDLETNVPYVEEITSLINARSTRGEGDGLIVGELMEEWPEDEAALEGLEQRVLANTLYSGILISEDAGLTTVIIKPYTYSTRGEGVEAGGFDEADEWAPGVEAEAEYLTAGEGTELYEAVLEVTARHRAPDFPIHLGGAVVISHAIDAAMRRDIVVFTGAAILAMCILLAVLFRRATGVLVPVLVVVLSLASTAGIMVLLGISGSTSLEILPPFLGSVAICDAVHILTIVYQRLSAGSGKEDAIAFALGHSALPVVMTSLTTAAGILSFTTAELAPVANLGILAPIGIMLALLYTVVLLPALLAILPLRDVRDGGRGPAGSVYGRALARVGDFAASHPWHVLAASFVLVLLSFAGITRVRFSHDSLAWFPKDDPLRIATELLDRRLKGAASLEILVDTRRENGVQEPETLHRLEAAMRNVESRREGPVRMGKALSIVDIVKETHQALNENRPSHRTIPRDRRLVAQELLLFENGGSDDMEEFVDSSFRTARLSVRVSSGDALLYRDLLRELELDLAEIFGEEIEFEMTGLVTLLCDVFANLLLTMSRSYGFALLVITPLMMLLLGSLRLGLLSMIPNLIPVIFTLGVMGWLDVPLDATTILIGAIVIGLAVDDTIHFMHKFQRYYSATGDARAAIHETLTTTGAAMLFTTLVLCGCFFIFTSAYLSNIAAFGLLAGMATIVAFIADVVLGPALMILLDRWRGRRVAGVASDDPTLR